MSNQSCCARLPRTVAAAQRRRRRWQCRESDGSAPSLAGGGGGGGHETSFSGTETMIGLAAFFLLFIVVLPNVPEIVSSLCGAQEPPEEPQPRPAVSEHVPTAHCGLPDGATRCRSHPLAPSTAASHPLLHPQCITSIARTTAGLRSGARACTRSGRSGREAHGGGCGAGAQKRRRCRMGSCLGGASTRWCLPSRTATRGRSAPRCASPARPRCFPSSPLLETPNQPAIVFCMSWNRS